MPVLPDLKWERFAAFVSQGELQAEAYKHAGFMAKYPAQAASKLANRPEVKARIEELKRRVTNRGVAAASAMLAITKEIIIRELWDNAEMAKVTKNASAVRNRALELIGKELGMFRDLEPVKAPTLADLSTEDLEKLLAQTPIDADPPTAAPAGPPETTQ